MHNESLWQLSNEIVLLQDEMNAIQDNPDLSDTEKDSQLNALFDLWLGAESNFKSKAEQIGEYIKYLNALTDARKTECKRIQGLIKGSEGKQEKLESYLHSQMEKLGIKKIEGTKVSISLRKKPPRVCLNGDPSELPQEFQRVNISPDLVAIKAYIKANPECPFAFMSEDTGYSLNIK